jgi:murein DD-endopeptidase MepM/ murein hydrolase activator NlpD
MKVLYTLCLLLLVSCTKTEILYQVVEVPVYKIKEVFLKEESPFEGFVSPMKDYQISSFVGPRRNPILNSAVEFHQGVDIFVKQANVEIYAVKEGIVVDSWEVNIPGRKEHPIYGGCVVISHSGGIYTLYGHMSKVLVRVGESVTTGQVIGYQGSTGKAVGAHLHFEVILDPFVFLNF